MSLEIAVERLHKIILKLFKSTIKKIPAFCECSEEQLENIIINVVFELMKKKEIIKVKDCQND